MSKGESWVPIHSFIHSFIHLLALLCIQIDADLASKKCWFVFKPSQDTQGTWRRHHLRYPSHVTTFSTILIVMISIAVIAAAIGTTELLFEFLDRYHRTKNDRNHCKSPSLWSTDGTPQGLQRAQRLQAQPDEAGDVDARPGGSRATWASGTSPSTDSMTRLTASNDGFHLKGSQPSRQMITSYMMGNTRLNAGRSLRKLFRNVVWNWSRSIRWFWQGLLAITLHPKAP